MTTQRNSIKPSLVRLAAAMAAFAALFCAGCGSVRTNVSLGAPIRDHWRVLVLPLDDSAGSRGAMERSIYGVTRTQGSSTVAARGVSLAFGSCPGFEIISPIAFREELERSGLTLPQAALLDSGKACDVARSLQADMVVIGRVPAYENAWFLFFPCAKVALTLEAYNPANSQRLWSAEISGRKMFASQRELVFDLASRAAGQVHARLLPSDDR